MARFVGYDTHILYIHHPIHSVQDLYQTSLFIFHIFKIFENSVHINAFDTGQGSDQYNITYDRKL